ncbi:MAG: DUF2905 domain-containing protein [Thermodesulfobacteriota bacterium]
MNPWPELGRLLLVLGVVLAAAGLLLMFWDKLPWLSRLPLGRLPGDINIEREGFRLSFPIVTCIIASVVLSLLLWLFRR